jgi:ectoine hydroxylase-related dioxygenase (phytanoyl-CoA dioxygenase family)
MVQTRSRYSLSAEQVQFFDDNGYLVLKNWINGDLLAKLQRAGSEWIDAGLNVDANDPSRRDYAFAKRTVGEVFYRVDYLHNKGQSASLELLGSPMVLGVAESLCGPNFVPTYESMVFKEAGDGEAIRWHQDAVHPRRHRIFNYDLYLDESRADAGALVVIPGSQTTILDACEMERLHGWTPPGSITVEMEPGDVLLHDVMVIHGSPRTVGRARRRTIYYEFRPAEQILTEGPWDAEWVAQRMSLIPLGTDAYRSAYPHAEQFLWQAAPEYRPTTPPDMDRVLRVLHEKHTPGSYCSAGSVPLD